MGGTQMSNPDRQHDTRETYWAVAASPFPIAAVEGGDHIVRYANPVFCQLTGKSIDELIGQPFSAIVPINDECLTLLDRVYETGQAEIFTAQQGSTPHPMYWSYAIWPISGTKSEATTIMFQVTETAHFHQQAAAMNEALLLASVRQHQLAEEAGLLNEQLKRANEDLKQFAFAASHDLQEPLRMITTYSQLLIKGYRGQLDGEAAMCVDSITRGTSRMRELLKGLLSYAEAGVDRGDRTERVDVNRVFEKATENLKPAIDENLAIVTCETLPDVYGQEAHLVQLLQNLIGNAVKYRGEETPRVHVSAEQQDGVWRFGVADNGTGIAPEHHQSIFGVFKRLHGQKIAGTGMGLAICQRVVERYGGSIWVDSQLGKGSTFYFTLPTNGRDQ